MSSEYDERPKYYWEIFHGNYIVKTVDDAGLEDEVEELNTLPLQGAFVLSTSKRIMNNFIPAISGIYTKIYITQIPIPCLGKINTGIS